MADKTVDNRTWLERDEELLKKGLAGEVGPVSVEVGPVNGCNHECLHCGYTQIFDEKRENQIIPRTEVFYRFLDDFHLLGGKEVYFAGSGEPTLHPDMFDWSDYGNKLGLLMQLSTNGIAFTDRKKEIAVQSMQWIRFSVNGGDAETYARVHGTDIKDYDRLKTNLKDMAAIKQESGSECLLFLQIALFQENYRSLDAMVEFFEDSGAELLIVRRARFEDNKDEWIPDKAFEDKLKQYDVNERIQVRWDSFSESEVFKCWKKCLASNFKTHMDYQGKMLACVNPDSYSYVYGNICHDRFKDIWFSERKKEIFKEVESLGQKLNCYNLCGIARDNRYINKWIENE